MPDIQANIAEKLIKYIKPRQNHNKQKAENHLNCNKLMVDP